MAEPTTREEIIKDIKENLARLSPDTVSKYAVMLSAHLAGLGENLATADLVYHQEWERIRMCVETDGFADKKSKATEAYYNKRMLETQEKSTVQIIQALKKRLGVMENELRSQC